MRRGREGSRKKARRLQEDGKKTARRRQEDGKKTERRKQEGSKKTLAEMAEKRSTGLSETAKRAGPSPDPEASLSPPVLAVRYKLSYEPAPPHEFQSLPAPAHGEFAVRTPVRAGRRHAGKSSEHSGLATGLQSFALADRAPSRACV